MKKTYLTLKEVAYFKLICTKAGFADDKIEKAFLNIMGNPLLFRLASDMLACAVALADYDIDESEKTIFRLFQKVNN